MSIQISSRQKMGVISSLHFLIFRRKSMRLIRRFGLSIGVSFLFLSGLLQRNPSLLRFIYRIVFMRCSRHLQRTFAANLSGRQVLFSAYNDSVFLLIASSSKQKQANKPNRRVPHPSVDRPRLLSRCPRPSLDGRRRLVVCSKQPGKCTCCYSQNLPCPLRYSVQCCQRRFWRLSLIKFCRRPK